MASKNSTTFLKKSQGKEREHKADPLPILVIVYDQKSNPIQGAMVDAPCTGLPAQYTDANGVAVFNIDGQCNCDQGTAQVTTKTCNMQVPIDCGTTQVQCQ